MATSDIDLLKVSQFRTGLTRVKAVIDELDGRKLQNVTVSGTTISFWTSDDTTGTAAYTVDFPEEIFLDQLQTQFVPNFAFSAATYPGATNPNLDGKPVFVLAVKGDKETNPHLSYSFVNLESLVDIYTAANAGISIAGYSIGAQVSETAGNLLSIANDGLFVGSDDTKIDKVTNAVMGNFAIWGASGTLADSGFTIAGDSAINTMLDTVFGTVGGGSGTPSGGEG